MARGTGLGERSFSFHPLVADQRPSWPYPAGRQGSRSLARPLQSQSPATQSSALEGWDESEGKHTMVQPTGVLLHFVGGGLIWKEFNISLRIDCGDKSQSHIISLVAG